MTTYKYVALDADGKKQRGSREARTERAARAGLVDQGLQPVRVRERKSLGEIEIRPQRVKRVELMHFSRQLASFVRAGIPILEAIEVLREATDNKTLQRVLLEVSDALQSGETFTDAVGAHPKVFPGFYRSVLQSSEYTGNLDRVLDQLASYIERDLDARRKIRSALTYPAVIFVAAIITVVILTGFVLPRFQVFFASLGATLPLPTRILLGTSAFMVKWWAVILAVAVLIVVGLTLFLRTDRGRRIRDRVLLALPAVGSTVRYAVIERFCRILSTMVQAGVPLPDAMAVASDGTGNVIYRTALDDVRDQMIRGEGIAAPLAATELFPSAATQMIRVGEDTGSLDAQLANTASFYEQELDYKIKNLTSLFEPAVIIFMGLIVGFVALSLVSAMYGIFNQVDIAS